MRRPCPSMSAWSIPSPENESILAGLPPAPSSALPARLLQERELADLDAFVGGLAHVIERERRCGRGDEGLHLVPGLPRPLDLGRDRDRRGRGPWREGHCDRVERERMAERNPLGGAFGGLNSGA